jgi:hypothetical protein
MDRADMTNLKKPGQVPSAPCRTAASGQQGRPGHPDPAAGRENQILRDQAAHFEHLYLDIVHSTSWKLAWPIRAAFKVLTLGQGQAEKPEKPQDQPATGSCNQHGSRKIP